MNRNVSLMQEALEEGIMQEWIKPVVIGTISGTLLLFLALAGYSGWGVYQEHRALWVWANQTQDRLAGIDQNLKDLVQDADLKTLVTHDQQIGELKARLDKLESQPDTEAENAESEGKGE